MLFGTPSSHIEMVLFLGALSVSNIYTLFRKKKGKKKDFGYEQITESHAGINIMWSVSLP